jgi:hypothetical protein
MLTTPWCLTGCGVSRSVSQRLHGITVSRPQADCFSFSARPPDMGQLADETDGGPPELHDVPLGTM